MFLDGAELASIAAAVEGEELIDYDEAFDGQESEVAVSAMKAKIALEPPSKKRRSLSPKRSRFAEGEQEAHGDDEDTSCMFSSLLGSYYDVESLTETMHS
jgi:hypothetical protein